MYMDDRYKEIFIEEVGEIYKEGILPCPWFSHNHTAYKLQWAAYIGKCGKPINALAFGINIEFRPAWRRIRPRLSPAAVSSRLGSVTDCEWHWWGRPGYICSNPDTVHIWEDQQVTNVDVSRWLFELDDIMNNRVLWHNSRLMRPQLQVVREVGRDISNQDADTVRENIRRAMKDMTPLMELFSGVI